MRKKINIISDAAEEKSNEILDYLGSYKYTSFDANNSFLILSEVNNEAFKYRLKSRKTKSDFKSAESSESFECPVDRSLHTDCQTAGNSKTAAPPDCETGSSRVFFILK